MTSTFLVVEGCWSIPFTPEWVWEYHCVQLARCKAQNALSHTQTPFTFCAASPGSLSFPGNGHSHERDHGPVTQAGIKRCWCGRGSIHKGSGRQQLQLASETTILSWLGLWRPSEQSIGKASLCAVLIITAEAEIFLPNQKPLLMFAEQCTQGCG